MTTRCPLWLSTSLFICLAGSLAAQELPRRTGLVRRGETPLTLVGKGLEVGRPAPQVVLRNARLEETALPVQDGRIRLVLTVPSLDTTTCRKEARSFDERAAQLPPEVEVVLVSRDLPFAQRRSCESQGLDRLRVLSDFDSARLGKSWGLLIEENGLLARAVVLLDRDGVVRYQQIVPDLTDEPDYDRALKEVGSLLGGLSALHSLSGSWQGTGTLNDQPIEEVQHWEWVLQGAFLRGTITRRYHTADGKPAEADLILFVRPDGQGGYRGTMVNSAGATDPLVGQETEDGALVLDQSSPRGLRRGINTFRPDGTLELRYLYPVAGEWREAGRILLERVER